MSTTINDDRILDARDMQAEVDQLSDELSANHARLSGRPSTFITAEQARSLDNMMSSYTVFALIESQAKAGNTDLYVAYNRLAPETMELLGAGGYRVRLGGVANDQAVISWAEE